MDAVTEVRSTPGEDREALALGRTLARRLERGLGRAPRTSCRFPLTLSSEARFEDTPSRTTSPLTEETLSSEASISRTITSPLTLSIAACLADFARSTSTLPDTDLACTSSATSATWTSPLTDCAFALPSTPLRVTLPDTDWISTSVPFGTFTR